MGRHVDELITCLNLYYSVLYVYLFVYICLNCLFVCLFFLLQLKKRSEKAFYLPLFFLGEHQKATPARTSLWFSPGFHILFK